MDARPYCNVELRFQRDADFNISVVGPTTEVRIPSLGMQVHAILILCFKRVFVLMTVQPHHKSSLIWRNYPGALSRRPRGFICDLAQTL